jgi:hypothetical protein
LAGPPGADALFELFAPQKNWIIGNSAGSPGNLYFNDATDGGYPFYIAPQASFGALVLNGAGVTVGTFSGSGAALTVLNASALASGTVPLARLPGAVLTNNEAGTVTFANNFYGSGFGYFNQLIVTNGVTSGNTILNYQGNGQSGFGILAPLVKVHI